MADPISVTKVLGGAVATLPSNALAVPKVLSGAVATVPSDGIGVTKLLAAVVLFPSDRIFVTKGLGAAVLEHADNLRVTKILGASVLASPDVPVYELSKSYTSDDGTIIRRLRRTPHIASENLTLFFDKLELVFEQGVAAEGDSPVCLLRWSDDGGRTWSNEHAIALGKIGEYRRRAIWRRLGRSRDRVFEIVITADMPVRLIDGFIDTTAGTS